MSDVGVRVELTGADEAKRKVDDLNKSIEQTGQAAQKTVGPAQQASAGLEKMGGAAAEGAEAFEGLTLKGAAAGALLGGALAAGAAYAWGKLRDGIETVRELGDRFNNLSQTTGISVEKLSGGLRLAAETTGSSIEGLASGINHLNKSIAEAADGTGKQADAFKRLGIDVHDAAGNLKSADQVLEEIAEAFKGSEDGAIKTEIAMTLLSRTGANLIPLLNQGADGLKRLEQEAKLAGITMSGETAEAAAKLNENMRILKAYGEGFWMGVASPIVDGLSKITTAMREARTAGEGFFGSLQAGAAKALQVMLGYGSDQQEMETISKRILELDKQRRAALARGAPFEANVIAGDIDRLQARQDELFNVLTVSDVQAKVELAPPTPPTPKPDKPQRTRVGRDWNPTSEAMADVGYWEDLVKTGEMSRQQFIQQLDQLAEDWQDWEDTRAKISAKAADERKKQWDEDRKSYINILTRQEAEERRLNAEGDAELRRMHAAQDAARDKSAQIEVRQINETTFLLKEQKMQALQGLLEKYQAMGPEGEKAVGRIRAEMEALQGQTRATGVIIQDVGFDMGRVWGAVHDGLAQGIGELARYALGMSSSIHSAGEAIKSFFLSIGNSIINMFSQIAANEVFRWIFGGGSAAPGAGVASSIGGGLLGALTGGGGGGGGGILGAAGNASSLYSAASGNSLLGSLFGGGAGLSGSAVSGEIAALTGSGVSVGGGLGTGAAAGLSALLGPLAIGAGFLLGASALFGGDDNPGPGVMTDADWAEARANNGYFTYRAGRYAGQSAWIDINGTLNDHGEQAAMDAENRRRYLEQNVNWGATGVDRIVSRPTQFGAGEAGTEHVQITPVGSMPRGGRGGVTIIFQGLTMMDNYQARRMAYELEKHR